MLLVDDSTRLEREDQKIQYHENTSDEDPWMLPEHDYLGCFQGSFAAWHVRTRQAKVASIVEGTTLPLTLTLIHCIRSSLLNLVRVNPR